MSTNIHTERPDSPDAIKLITELDEELGSKGYPSESRHGFSVDKLIREGVIFFVTRINDIPAGCGGLKYFANEYAEVKRMFVRPQFRGMGLGKSMLEHLADHARQNQVLVLRLETGIHQLEAIKMYENFGFVRRSPFGEYQEDPNSVYLEMRLSLS
jgi:GNAT superfamily N-acetyltransferase